MPDLIIRVDFFKPTGKWYCGGEVNVGEARLWKGDFPQAIVDNQDILEDGWQEDNCFTAVTQDLPGNMAKVDYQDFSMALFKPEKFVGLVRK